VGNRARHDPEVAGADLVYEEGCADQAIAARSLQQGNRRIQVAGEAGYQEGPRFHEDADAVECAARSGNYRDGQPLFSRMGVESQLDAMFSPTVQLRIRRLHRDQPDRALVSIDVNSGRSTREHHIEDTALKTNLEAAEEVARQLRLRDLAGLIVDRLHRHGREANNRSVERKLSDCLRQDRARIQVGRISHSAAGKSRQRIRASVLESSTGPARNAAEAAMCVRYLRLALQLLRGLEESDEGRDPPIRGAHPDDVALYVLNQNAPSARSRKQLQGGRSP